MISLLMLATVRHGESARGHQEGKAAEDACVTAHTEQAFNYTAAAKWGLPNVRRARSMDLSSHDLASLVRMLCAAKLHDTGAARTGGGGAQSITYNNLRFNAKETGTPLMLRGQRDPAARYDLLDVDFTNKTVLDLGCNAGGMLLGSAEVVRQAVGVDFDASLIQVASAIVAQLGWSTQEVGFHRFDFNNQSGPPLDALLEYAQDGRREFDIITMYSINMWIHEPERLISWALQHARTFIMETNRVGSVQEQSIAVLRRKCRRLVEKTDYKRCPDCYLKPTRTVAPRRLWVCETLQADVNWRSRDLFSSKIVPRRPTISEQRAGLSVPVFDNLTAAQQDSTTARYRLGVDGARLESSKPFAQASTKVFSAPRTKSEVIKMIGPNFCRSKTVCPFAAFIVMEKVVGIQLSAIKQQYVDTHLISNLRHALKVLQQLRIVHSDTHLNNFVMLPKGDAANNITSSTVLIIDYGAAFLNLSELTRTETLIKLSKDHVPRRTWDMFRQSCNAAGQGDLFNGPGLSKRQDVDQNMVAWSNKRFQPNLRPDTFEEFKQSIVREVSLQTQAARAGVAPKVLHVWLERDIIL